jgi:hypothetical protein
MKKNRKFYPFFPFYLDIPNTPDILNLTTKRAQTIPATAFAALLRPFERERDVQAYAAVVEG